MNFMYLFNLNYTYRAKTEAIYQNREAFFFDFYIVDDQIFEQYYLF